MSGRLSDIQPLDRSRIQEADFELIKSIARGIYVEVGTYYGASAYAASFGADYVNTIDIYEWLPHVWEELGRKNIYFFKGTSVDFAKKAQKDWITTLFIDGSHEYDYVKLDIEALVPLVKQGGIIMFDDYRKGSTGVYDAVNEYIKREKPKIISKPAEGCSILVLEKEN